LEDQPQ
ncbi:hypothetical protein BN1708_020039, partial [Verticillium longisporum]